MKEADRSGIYSKNAALAPGGVTPPAAGTNVFDGERRHPHQPMPICCREMGRLTHRYGGGRSGARPSGDEVKPFFGVKRLNADGGPTRMGAAGHGGDRSQKTQGRKKETGADKAASPAEERRKKQKQPRPAARGVEPRPRPSQGRHGRSGCLCDRRRGGSSAGIRAKFQPSGEKLPQETGRPPPTTKGARRKMANTNALGMVETRGLVGAIEAADAMVRPPTSSWWARSRWAAVW